MYRFLMKQRALVDKAVLTRLELYIIFYGNNQQYLGRTLEKLDCLNICSLGWDVSGGIMFKNMQ